MCLGGGAATILRADGIMCGAAVGARACLHVQDYEVDAAFAFELLHGGLRGGSSPGWNDG